MLSLDFARQIWCWLFHKKTVLWPPRNGLGVYECETCKRRIVM
jgi:hypothetical protein